MGSDFDEGSFKKARSFLMVFSTMLLVLWYFEAEMSTLSLLGNSIKFTANTHNLWFVLPAANLYFFCRYIQHLPPGWRKPGKNFEEFFDSTFCGVTKLVYRRKLYAHAWEHFRTDHSVDGVTKFKVKPSGSRHKERYEAHGFFPSLRPEMKVDFSLPYTWIEKDRLLSSTGSGTVVTPHRVVVDYSRVSSCIKVVFLAPWFTEHLFPMLYGLCAVGVGFWSWHTVDVSAPVASQLQASMQANPRSIRCISESIQAKHSVISVACIPAPTVTPGRLIPSNL